MRHLIALVRKGVSNLRPQITCRDEHHCIFNAENLGEKLICEVKFKRLRSQNAEVLSFLIVYVVLCIRRRR